MRKQPDGKGAQTRMGYECEERSASDTRVLAKVVYDRKKDEELAES